MAQSASVRIEQLKRLKLTLKRKKIFMIFLVLCQKQYMEERMQIEDKCLDCPYCYVDDLFYEVMCKKGECVEE